MQDQTLAPTARAHAVPQATRATDVTTVFVPLLDAYDRSKSPTPKAQNRVNMQLLRGAAMAEAIIFLCYDAQVSPLERAVT
jgi:hypothetical protein